MSQTTRTVCWVCSREYSNQGIHAHIRGCYNRGKTQFWKRDFTNFSPASLASLKEEATLCMKALEAALHPEGRFAKN